MITLANREDQEEMWHNAAFHQGLQCLLRRKLSSKKMQFYLEIEACNPSKYSGTSQVYCIKPEGKIH